MNNTLWGSLWIYEWNNPIMHVQAGIFSHESAQPSRSSLHCHDGWWWLLLCIQKRIITVEFRSLWNPHLLFQHGHRRISSFKRGIIFTLRRRILTTLSFLYFLCSIRCNSIGGLQKLFSSRLNLWAFLQCFRTPCYFCKLSFKNTELIVWSTEIYIIVILKRFCTFHLYVKGNWRVKKR